MKITLATKITIARIFLIIPTVILFVLGMVFEGDSLLYPLFMALSSVLFVVLCATDVLDGHIARKTGTVTDLGKFLDPIADKVVVVIMLLLVICHGSGNGRSLDIFAGNDLVITLIGGIVIARELIIGAFRCIAAGKGLVLAADVYGKVKTVFLDIAITILMVAGTHLIVAWIGSIFFYAGGIMAVVSGVNYVVKNKHVLLDKQTEVKEEVVVEKAEVEETTEA